MDKLNEMIKMPKTDQWKQYNEINIRKDGDLYPVILLEDTHGISIETQMLNESQSIPKNSQYDEISSIRVFQRKEDKLELTEDFKGSGINKPYDLKDLSQIGILRLLVVYLYKKLLDVEHQKESEALRKFWERSINEGMAQMGINKKELIEKMTEGLDLEFVGDSEDE